MANPKRKKALFVRVTSKEAAQIEQAARAKGLPVAAFVRLTLLTSLEKTHAAA